MATVQDFRVKSKIKSLEGTSIGKRGKKRKLGGRDAFAPIPVEILPLEMDGWGVAFKLEWCWRSTSGPSTIQAAPTAQVTKLVSSSYGVSGVSSGGTILVGCWARGTGVCFLNTYTRESYHWNTKTCGRDVLRILHAWW